MKKQDKLTLIRNTGVIAIMRASSSDQIISAVEAICKAGVKAIEVTLTTPGAVKIIEQVKNNFDDEIIFGAGSVLDPETARTVIHAGADFIVAPTLNINMIALCNRYSIPVIPGCFSPTEALTAWEAGADMIKLFPANLGGPGLLKAILAPMPYLEIVPVGGVDFNNAADFIQSGAVAIGIGGNLVNDKLLQEEKFDEIASRAKKLMSIIKQAKQGC